MNDSGEEDLDLVAKMEELYNKLGITVYNTDGTLKNTFELLQSLASVYKTLTAAEKAYVTETIAGKNQAQNAAAILNNFSVAVEAANTAVNSNNSALIENSKYVDSIEGKLKNLDSEWEKLSQNIVDDDLIKFVVDLGTGLLKFLNSDFSQFNLGLAATFASSKLLYIGLSNINKVISPIIKGFGNLINTSSQVFHSFDSFKNSITLVTNRMKIFELQQKVNDAISKKTKINIDNVKTSMQAYGISIEGVTNKEKAKIAIDAAAKSSTLALNAVLAAGSLALTLAITVWQKVKQAEEEAAQSALENAQKANEEAKSLDDLTVQIISLKEALDNNNTSYKDAKKAREDLIGIQEDLVKEYGDEAKGINLVSDSTDELIKKTQKLKAEYAGRQLREKEVGFAKAEEEIYGKNELLRDMQLFIPGDKFYDKNTSKAVEDYIKEVKDVIGKYSTLAETSRDRVAFTTENVDASKKALTAWKEYLQDNSDELIKSGVYTKDTYMDMLSDIQKELDNIAKKKGTYYSTLEEKKQLELTAAEFDIFKEELTKLSQEEVLTEDKLKSLIKTHPGLDEALKNSGYSIDKLLDEYQNYDKIMDKVSTEGTEGLKEKLKELSNQTSITESDVESLKNQFGDELTKILDGTGISFDEFIDHLKTASEASHNLVNIFNNLKNSVGSIESNIGILKTAVNEFNESGFITAETLDNLFKNNLFEYLEFTEEGLKANTKALIDSADAAKYKALIDLKAAFATDALAIATGDTSEASSTAKTIMKGLGDEIDYASLKAAAGTGSMFSIAGGIAAINQAAGKDIDITGKEKQLQQLVNVYNKFAQGIVNTNFSSSLKPSSSAAASTKEWWEEQLSSLKDQFKYNEITIDEYIKGLEKLLSKVKKGTDAYKQISEELQKQKLTKVEDDYKRGKISLDKYIDSLKDLIKVYKQGTEAWNELADKIKKGLQDKAKTQQEDLDTAESAAIGLIDEEIEKLEKLKEEQEDYYDKLIKDKEKANDETEREIELARLEEALANAKNEKIKRVWREGIGWLWEADQEAINEAQEALDEFNKEQEINALEEAKEATIENLDAQIKAWEEYKNTWESVADDYETAQARMTLANQLGADAETDILNQRLNAWEKYKNDYLATMGEIQRLEGTASGDLPELQTAKTTTSTTTKTETKKPSLSKGSYVSVKPGTKWYGNSYGGGNSGTASSGTIKYVNEGASHPYNIDGLGWIRKSDIVGYNQGGIVDYTGLAMLHGTKTKPEFVLNNEQMKNLIYSLGRPGLAQSKSSQNCVNNNYNFGNIELPNVSNAHQFITELKSLVNITKHQ